MSVDLMAMTQFALNIQLHGNSEIQAEMLNLLRVIKQQQERIDELELELEEEKNQFKDYIES